jgi:Protein of unknown function (DUF3046)
VPAAADRYAGSLVGRRAIKITESAPLLPLLPTYLITTHRAKGLLSRSAASRAGERRPFARRTGLIPVGSILGGVRLTEFWRRMNAQFGEVYAQSVAKDFVFSNLGGRTVERALADGVDTKAVWRAVCDTFKVPENLR